jgi:hypothetical protein
VDRVGMRAGGFVQCPTCLWVRMLWSLSSRHSLKSTLSPQAPDATILESSTRSCSSCVALHASEERSHPAEFISVEAGLCTACDRL